MVLLVIFSLSPAFYAANLCFLETLAQLFSQYSDVVLYIHMFSVGISVDE